MSKPSIRTYEDLLAEEQRLLGAIKGQQAVLREDVMAFKENMQPVVKVASFLNKLATRDHTGPLSSFGLDFGIDLIVRKVLLARAGWLTKVLVPFVIKNYSSHLINEEQRTKFAEKIQGFFEKIRKRGKPSKPKGTDGPSKSTDSPM